MYLQLNHLEIMWNCSSLFTVQWYPDDSIPFSQHKTNIMCCVATKKTTAGSCGGLTFNSALLFSLLQHCMTSQSLRPWAKHKLCYDEVLSRGNVSHTWKGCFWFVWRPKVCQRVLISCTHPVLFSVKLMSLISEWLHASQMSSVFPT